MDESKVKQMAEEWSSLLCKKGIPHAVFGSVAMLLHECEPRRAKFKDIDFLLPEDRAQEMRDILVKKGFTMGKNGNYGKDGVIIGIATPRTHRGLRSPTDGSARTKIGGVWVLTLDGLIDAKRLAVDCQMKRIVTRGYRPHREKSVVKQLEDFCALCCHRDKRNANSELP